MNFPSAMVNRDSHQSGSASPLADAAGRPGHVSEIVLFSLAVSATLYLYSGIFHWLFSSWFRNPDYAHGVLVIPFVAYLVWARRNRLEVRPIAADAVIGVLLILFGVSIRIVAIFTSILTLEGLSLIPFLAGLVWVCFGRQVFFQCALPICYLLFMIPLPGFVGNQLSGFLQQVATAASVFSLQTLGIPVLADGNIIRMPNGVIGVAQACSGIRMLFTFFAINVGYCLAVRMRWLEKIVVVCAAVPIAILTNCMRITLTGLAYEYIDSSTAEKLFHDFAGVIMIPLGLLLLFTIRSLFGWIVVVDDSEHEVA